MTIYERLIAKGYTDQEIRDAGSRGPDTRSFRVMTVDTPDGAPIVGIVYSSDFRSEEETGPGEIRKALVQKDDKHAYIMSDKATSLIGRFLDESSLIISRTPLAGEGDFLWGHDILPFGSDYPLEHGSVDAPAGRTFYDGTYDSYWEDAVGYARGIPDKWKLTNRYNRVTLGDLKTMAVTLGVTVTGRKTKQAYIDAITASGELDKLAERPDQWPAWFHHGDVFVARADSGLAADVLDMLYEAGKGATLAQGGGMANPFGGGMSFYDGADVGPKLIKQNKEQARWYDTQMRKLDKVAKALKEKGHVWYALGRPRNGFKSMVGKGETNPEDVYYWLNGRSYPMTGSTKDTSHQPYGWYTLDQLKAEKFITDLESRDGGKVTGKPRW